MTTLQTPFALLFTFAILCMLGGMFYNLMRKKEMKLEIHHLAPYLPYGLTVINTIDGTIMEMSVESEMYPYVRKTELNGIVSICVVLNSNVFKPILRPLSDLTKEIDHDGEIFIATRILDDLFFNFSFRVGNENELIIRNRPANMFADAMHYNEIINKLLSWHFDIFGLIDQGLAININTLNQKK